MSMSRLEAGGPKEHEKTRHWSGTPPAMIRPFAKAAVALLGNDPHDP
jgi:hypothetical protein